MSNRVFVSGATGVIGSRVVPQLIAAGHRVTAVARSPEKRAALERAGAWAIDVDLFDPIAVRRAVAGHDVVINLATHIAPSSRAFLPVGPTDATVPTLRPPHDRSPASVAHPHQP